MFSGATALSWRRLDDENVKALLPPEARDRLLVADVPGEGPLPSFFGGSHIANGRKADIPVSLFAGSKRLCCARWPDKGFASTVSDGKTNDVGKLTGFFKFDDLETLGKLAKEPFTWAFGLWKHEWADLSSEVVSVDVNGGRMAIAPEILPFGLKKGGLFYVFNAFFALNRPSEWVVDCERRRIYLWPDEDAPAADAVLADG